MYIANKKNKIKMIVFCCMSLLFAMLILYLIDFLVQYYVCFCTCFKHCIKMMEYTTSVYIIIKLLYRYMHSLSFTIICNILINSKSVNTKHSICYCRICNIPAVQDKQIITLVSTNGFPVSSMPLQGI